MIELVASGALVALLVEDRAQRNSIGHREAPLHYENCPRDRGRSVATYGYRNVNYFLTSAADDWGTRAHRNLMVRCGFGHEVK